MANSNPTLWTATFLERVEFESVVDARTKATWFRREYNTIRPHSSIDYKTPREFSETIR
jgi:transposase InsO family protein